MSEKVGEFLSGLAKDIVNSNIHGYGSKIQEKVDEKIKIFNKTASVYTDEERLKYATKKVFKNHKIAFEKLNDHPQHHAGDKAYEVIKVLEVWNLDFHRGNAVNHIYRSSIEDTDAKIQNLEKAKWYIQRKIDLLKEKE